MEFIKMTNIILEKWKLSPFAQFLTFWIVLNGRYQAKLTRNVSYFLLGCQILTICLSKMQKTEIKEIFENWQTKSILKELCMAAWANNLCSFFIVISLFQMFGKTETWGWQSRDWWRITTASIKPVSEKEDTTAMEEVSVRWIKNITGDIQSFLCLTVFFLLTGIQSPDTTSFLCTNQIWIFWGGIFQKERNKCMDFGYWTFFKNLIFSVVPQLVGGLQWSVYMYVSTGNSQEAWCTDISMNKSCPSCHTLEFWHMTDPIIWADRGLNWASESIENVQIPPLVPEISI